MIIVRTIAKLEPQTNRRDEKNEELIRIAEAIRRLREKNAEVYRHIVGLIKTLS